MPVAPRVRPGDPIRAVDFNTISDAAGMVFRGAGGAGVNASITPAGIGISAGEQSVKISEPAQMALVQNIGATDIDPFEPMSLTLPYIVQSPMTGYTGNPLDDYRGDRVLEAYLSTENFSGRFVVAAEAIPAGRAGMAWISGVCLCMVDRYNADSGATTIRRIRDRADTYAGGAFLQLGECGAAEILWIYNRFELKRAPCSPDPAIIRFSSRNTTGVGIVARGNNELNGIAEVIEWDDMAVFERYPGVVRLA